MKPFFVDAFMEIALLLGDISEAQTLADEHRERFKLMVSKLERILRFYDLVCSVETAKKLLVWAENHAPEPSELHNLTMELRGRMIDETRGREFFTLSSNDANCFHHPTQKWEKVIERFPSVGSDVEEAWKCYALARYTAAVFHSLQVVELGLIELGGFVGVADPLSGWTAVAQRLKQIVEKKHPQRADFERDNFPFIEQVQGTVEGLKNAWRNKVSHAYGRLTVMTGEEFHPDVAEEILIATRAFMRRLAEGLPASEKHV